MANFFENKDRNVIPNWRNFKNTARLGDLNGIRKTSVNFNTKLDITDLVEDWQIEKNIGIAADILSAAIVLNINNNKNVIDAINFIKENQQYASNTLIEMASSFSRKFENDDKKNDLDLKEKEVFQDRSNLLNIFRQIHYLKSSLTSNPKNSIFWAELARLYSILGQNNKAKRSILNALWLNPENRYILRSMVRFSAHLDEEEDIEYVHKILRNSDVTKHDTWLLATEIALSTMRGRYSKYIKLGKELINSNNFDPFNISELASSIGTAELKNGSLHKSREFFKKSLINPNDNALAQATWASQKDVKIYSLIKENYKQTLSYEAIARNYFDNEQWKESLEFSINWFLDLPFSKSPILFGSNIAGLYLKDYVTAIDLNKSGLISHQNDQSLLNNIAYYNLILNELGEGKKYIDKAMDPNSKSEVSEICLTATRGLYYFKKKSFEQGRNLYQSALEAASRLNNPYYYNMALLNYIREEIIINSELADSLVGNLNNIIIGTLSKDEQILKNEVLNLYKRNSIKNNSLTFKK